MSKLVDFLNFKLRKMHIVGYENAIDYYRTVLPEALVAFSLTLDVQRQLSERVAEWMSNNPSDSCVMYVWSKMSSNAALEDVLRFIDEHSGSMDEETQRQALSALQNMLPIPSEEDVYSRLMAALNKYDPTPFIERGIQSPLPGLRRCAEHCAELNACWLRGL